MKSIIYSFLAALSGTIAATFFLKLTQVGLSEISITTLMAYIGLSFILWAPTNAFFALALRHGVPTTVYTAFGVATAVLDTLSGIIILKQNSDRPWLLILGITLGLAVIILHSSSEEEGSELKIDNKGLEYGTYTLVGVLIVLGYLSRNMWLQLFSYCLADFLGAVLTVKMMGRLSRMAQFWQDWIGGIVGFAPAMVSGIILLANLQILPVAGPAMGIASAAFALPGTALFFRNKVNWFKAAGLLALGSLSIWLVYVAYY